ncbi:MAG TPA: hypothetical protein VJ691_12745, partial [Vicinamibacterales bacterium]|nr:hypothetical protein [Vicinamibacterales bacterium]
ERLQERGVRFVFNESVNRIDAGTPTIVATPAPTAARLIEPHAPAFARAVAAVRMSPLVSVTQFFEPQPADLHGFGMLFPSESGVHALGVLFNADIFEGRGPSRAERWIVGDRDSAITAWDDQRLLAALATDRRVVTGRDQAPVATHITRWPQAIPVYDKAIVEVSELQSTLPPWLGVAGNFLGRIGVAALLDQAGTAANGVR